MFPVPVSEPLHHINPFLSTTDTVAITTGTVSCQQRSFLFRFFAVPIGTRCCYWTSLVRCTAILVVIYNFLAHEVANLFGVVCNVHDEGIVDRHERHNCSHAQSNKRTNKRIVLARRWLTETNRKIGCINPEILNRGVHMTRNHAHTSEDRLFCFS